jgi:23S rRNA (cytidine1920-2'-O)/16S rRNA (cytidine1409-2'-O)-methyltransferase
MLKSILVEDDAKVGAKERLDVLLNRRGLTESRERAKALILAGQVRVAGRVVDKAGTRVPVDVELTVEEPPPYVSRGGIKLAAALEAFALEVTGKVVADVGASTGGFTDCLLQRGASRVYAIDVGYGQLAWKLRRDRRVAVMERVNARYLERLPERVDLVTADVSFISLTVVLATALSWLKPQADVVALVKPQFEAGRRQVGTGGVVREPQVHRQVLEKITAWGSENGLVARGIVASPITGPAGNLEFLIHWSWGRGAGELELDRAIAACLAGREQD